jgi:copper chaperone CopZ
MKKNHTRRSKWDALLIKALILAGAVMFSPGPRQAMAASTGQIVVHVRGLVCDLCIQGIKKQFSSVAAAESVDVSLEKKTVTIRVKPGAVLSDDTIKEKLQDAGYMAATIERQ